MLIYLIFSSNFAFTSFFFFFEASISNSASSRSFSRAFFSPLTFS
jgi:hypothetical protein